MGTRVKHLRSHNGREYCLKVFDDYLKTKGTTSTSNHSSILSYTEWYCGKDGSNSS